MTLFTWTMYFIFFLQIFFFNLSSNGFTYVLISLFKFQGFYKFNCLYSPSTVGCLCRCLLITSLQFLLFHILAITISFILLNFVCLILCVNICFYFHSLAHPMCYWKINVNFQIYLAKYNFKIVFKKIERTNIKIVIHNKNKVVFTKNKEKKSNWLLNFWIAHARSLLFFLYPYISVQNFIFYDIYVEESNWTGKT